MQFRSDQLRIGDVILREGKSERILYDVYGFTSRGKLILRNLHTGALRRVWWQTASDLPRRYRRVMSLRSKGEIDV